MRINNTEYKIPELNFNTICALEDMGVSLGSTDLKAFSTVRALLALSMNGDLAKAGNELEAHIMAGGKLDELVSEFTRAMEESDFFHSLKEM